MNARREDQIASMLIIGIVMLVIGGFLFMVGLMIKIVILVALGPILVAGGVGLAGWAVFFGHFTNRSVAKSGVQWINGCYIVSRFAIDQNGEMLFSDFEDADLPKIKYYVRVKMPSGNDQEYECSRELISQVGEGSRGGIQVKGRWLSSFAPEPRPEQP